MRKEYSCGVVALHEGRVLVVYNKKGHWALPKGHQDADENPPQTALRELAEETGITEVELDKSQTYKERYQFTENGQQIDKTVTYWLGNVKNPAVKYEDELIIDGKWLSFSEAIKKATYPATKNVLKQAKKRLKL